MQLSNAERIILYNQYRILQALIPDEAEHFSHAAAALLHGYTSEYFRFVSLARELSAEQCREVKDILDLYRVLTFSYRDLEDKSDMDESLLKFPGFDGNDEIESEYLAYTIYLLDDLKLWQELRRDGDYNSHSENLKEYREMVEKHQACTDRAHLTKKEIQAILENAPHAWN